MRLLLDPTAAGFDYRASGGSQLGPFTSNGQILLPHERADGDRHRRARRRRRACQRQPALRSRRLHRPPDARQRHARRDARFRAGRAGAADRRAPHRRQRELPRRLLGAQRPRRRHDHPRRRPDDGRRQRRRARHRSRRRSRSPGSPPTRSWSTARARSAPPSPAAAAPPSPSRRWPTSRPTRSG